MGSYRFILENQWLYPALPVLGKYAVGWNLLLIHWTALKCKTCATSVPVQNTNHKIIAAL